MEKTIINITVSNFALLHEDFKAALGNNYKGLTKQRGTILLHYDPNLTPADRQTIRDVIAAHDPDGKSAPEREEDAIEDELERLRRDLPSNISIVTPQLILSLVEYLHYTNLRLTRVERRLGIQPTPE